MFVNFKKKDMEAQAKKNQDIITAASAAYQANGNKIPTDTSSNTSIQKVYNPYLAPEDQKAMTEADKAKKQADNAQYDSIQYFRDQNKKSILERYKSNPNTVSGDELSYYFDQTLAYPKYQYEKDPSFYQKKNAADIVNQQNAVDKVNSSNSGANPITPLNANNGFSHYDKNLNIKDLLKNPQFKDYNVINKNADRVGMSDMPGVDAGKNKTLVRQTDGTWVVLDTNKLQEQLNSGKFDNSSWKDKLDNKLQYGVSQFFNGLTGLGQGALAGFKKNEDITGNRFGALTAPLQGEQSVDENKLTGLKKQQIDLQNRATAIQNPQLAGQMGFNNMGMKAVPSDYGTTTYVNDPSYDKKKDLSSTQSKLKDIVKQISDMEAKKASGNWKGSTIGAQWQTAKSAAKQLVSPESIKSNLDMNTTLQDLKAAGSAVVNSLDGELYKNPDKKLSTAGDFLTRDKAWDPNATSTKVAGNIFDTLSDPAMYMSLGTEGLVSAGGKAIDKKLATKMLEDQMVKSGAKSMAPEALNTIETVKRKTAQDITDLHKAQNGNISEDDVKNLWNKNMQDYLNNRFDSKKTDFNSIQGTYPQAQTNRIINAKDKLANNQQEQQLFNDMVDQSNKNQFPMDQKDGKYVYDQLNKLQNNETNLSSTLDNAKYNHKQGWVNSLVNQTKQGMARNERLDALKGTYLDKNAGKIEAHVNDLTNNATRPYMQTNGMTFLGQNIVPLPYKVQKGLQAANQKINNMPVVSQFNKLFNATANVGDETQQQIQSTMNKAAADTRVTDSMAQQALSGIPKKDIDQAWYYRSRPNDYTLPESMKKEVTVKNPLTGETQTTTPYDFIHNEFENQHGKVSPYYKDMNHYDNYTPGRYTNPDSFLQRIGLQNKNKPYQTQFKPKSNPTPLDTIEKHPELKPVTNLGNLLVNNAHEGNQAIAAKQLENWMKMKEATNPNYFNKQEKAYLDRFINPHDYYVQKNGIEKAWNNGTDKFRRLAMTTQTGTALRNWQSAIVQENMDSGGNPIKQVINGVRGFLAPHIGVKLKDGTKLTAEQYRNLAEHSGIGQGMGLDEFSHNYLTDNRYGAPTLGKMFNPMNLTKPGQVAMQKTEQWARNPTFIRALDKYGTSPSGVNKAMQDVYKTHFNYNVTQSLTPFEQRFMREIMPFYTWTRFSTPYFTKAAFQHPGLTNAWGNQIYNLGNTKDDQRNQTQNLQDYEKGRNLMSLGKGNYLKMMADPVASQAIAYEDPIGTVASGMNPIVKGVWDAIAPHEFSNTDQNLQPDATERPAILGKGITGWLQDHAPVVNKLMGVTQNDGPYDNSPKPGLYQSARAYQNSTNVLAPFGQWTGLARDWGGEKQSQRLLNMFGGIGTSSIDAGARNRAGVSEALKVLKKQMDERGIVKNDQPDPNADKNSPDLSQKAMYDTQKSVLGIMDKIDKANTKGMDTQSTKNASAKLNGGNTKYTDSYGDIKETFDVWGNPVSAYVVDNKFTRKGLSSFQRGLWNQVQADVAAGKAQHEKDIASYKENSGKNFEEIYKSKQPKGKKYPWMDYAQRAK